jgi:hypothetical protein
VSIAVDELAAIIAARDPLAAARAAGAGPGGEVTVERGPAPAGWLVDGDEERPIADHAAAHAAGRPSEAAVAYGAGRDPRAVAERIDALARLARETGLLRAVCPVPGEGTEEHWRRLGPAACQIAVAFGATGWRIPAKDRADPARLAAAVGAEAVTG